MDEKVKAILDSRGLRRLDDRSIDETGKTLLGEIANFGRNAARAMRRYADPRWQSRDLDVCFIDHASLNATVCSGEQSDWIVLNRGVIEIVYGNTLGLFGQPQFAPSLGEPKPPLGPSVGQLRSFPRYGLTCESEDERIAACTRPACTKRLELAKKIAWLACAFLVTHEIGHVMAGHLELRRRNGFGDDWLEFEEGTSRELCDIPQWMLECDADAFAVQVHMELGMLDDNMFEEDPVLEGTYQVSRGTARIERLLIAVSILFRSADWGGTCRSIRAGGTHPSPHVRACMCLVNALFVVLWRKRIDQDKSTELVARTIGEVETMWREIRGVRPGAGGANAVTGETLEVATKMKQLVRDRMPEIEQFARLRPTWRHM